MDTIKIFTCKKRLTDRCTDSQLTQFQMSQSEFKTPGRLRDIFIPEILTKLLNSVDNNFM